MSHMDVVEKTKEGNGNVPSVPGFPPRLSPGFVRVSCFRLQPQIKSQSGAQSGMPTLCKKRKGWATRPRSLRERVNLLLFCGLLGCLVSKALPRHHVELKKRVC